MAAPLKVLFLLEDLCFGGTQTQNLELAARLDRKLFEPAILTLTGPTDLDDRARKANVPLFHMGKSRSVPPLFFLGLGRFIKRLAPDILVPCTALPNIWGRIWGRLSGVPVILGTCRGGGAPRRQYEKWLWRLCHGIVCNSHELVYAMSERGVSKARLTYVPNGVDTDRFKPTPKKLDPRNALIVTVARLARDKDQKTLLSAFAIVNEHFPQARLRLVGEGPEEENLRKFAQKHLSEEAAAQIEFAGASANPAEHYAEADIFVLSSVLESQPNAILEAMSCGLPICATEAGSVQRMLSGNGLVSQPGDEKALANNILACLRSPAMAEQMGRAAREKAESDYSFHAMVGAHQEIFMELWEKHGGA